MSFRYFAYGSNLWLPQLRSRCPSAVPVGTAKLHDWELRYDKPSRDGSAKLDIVPSLGSLVHGAVMEIDDADRPALDAAEHLYDPITVALDDGQSVLTYRWTGPPAGVLPYDWYANIAQAGARAHGIDASPLATQTTPDPLAPNIRPATEADVGLIADILSEHLRSDRYHPHPGDVYWWMFHSDPRYPDHVSFWIQGTSGLLTIDQRNPEIIAIARSGSSVWPMIEWGQRRLHGQGAIGFVDGRDTEMSDALRSRGYIHQETDISYNWDLLRRPIPEPTLPDGWTLRPIGGEHEANNRRAASHAAFRSKMNDSIHLDRYLRFMRSPVYEPDRDLVAVAPDGRIASFIVWWSDRSGVAQIEPFGTHPEFQRRGLGRALTYYALGRMAAEGMHTARVMTNDWRVDATGFYEGVGFRVDGPVHWWVPEQASLESGDAGSH